MLPILLGIGAAVSSTITAAEAAAIGAGVGAATAAGMAALNGALRKKRPALPESEEAVSDDAFDAADCNDPVFRDAIGEALSVASEKRRRGGKR